MCTTRGLTFAERLVMIANLAGLHGYGETLVPEAMAGDATKGDPRRTGDGRQCGAN